MLWLALHLPHFALEISPQQDETLPRAIYSAHNTRPVILAANPAAEALGICPGISLAAARSLSQNLHAEPHSPSRQEAALHRLALWAQQFTPIVSLHPPAGLLLEIGASLTLFHGLEKLQQHLAREIRQLGYSAVQGVAPAPSAAWLLALNHDSRPVQHIDELQARLAPLPLASLPFAQWNLPEKLLPTLHGIGLRNLGDCLALPRSALGQRTGNAFLLKLEQLLGHHPELRQPFEAPEHYSSQLLLPNTVDNTAPLAFVLQRMLRELAGYLLARNSGAQHMQLTFIAPPEYRQHHPQTLELSLLSPSRDSEHLFKLWSEKLDKVTLHTPIEGLQLDVPTMQALDAENLDLLTPARQQQQSFTQFIELLRSRLGQEALQQLQHREDHRASHNTRSQRFSSANRTAQPHHTHSTPNRQRPLWLLDPPQALQNHRHQPQYHGPLNILHGPERLESGWWDGHDQRRDYYIAENPRRQILWIYNTLRQPEHWFLHGFFS